MIPITCDNPEKTMEFLNLTYKDKDIVNLLIPWNRRNALQLC